MADAETLVGDAVGQDEATPVIKANPQGRARGEQQGIELGRAPSRREVVEDQDGVVAPGAELRPKGGHLGQGRGAQRVAEPVEAELVEQDDLVQQRRVAQGQRAVGGRQVVQPSLGIDLAQPAQRRRGEQDVTNVGQFDG